VSFGAPIVTFRFICANISSILFFSSCRNWRNLPSSNTIFLGSLAGFLLPLPLMRSSKNLKWSFFFLSISESSESSLCSSSMISSTLYFPSEALLCSCNSAISPLISRIALSLYLSLEAGLIVDGDCDPNNGTYGITSACRCCSSNVSPTILMLFSLDSE